MEVGGVAAAASARHGAHCRHAWARRDNLVRAPAHVACRHHAIAASRADDRMRAPVTSARRAGRGEGPAAPSATSLETMARSAEEKRRMSTAARKDRRQGTGRGVPLTGGSLPSARLRSGEQVGRWATATTATVQAEQ